VGKKQDDLFGFTQAKVHYTENSQVIWRQIYGTF
jgi:hypothetical protein